MSNLSRDEFNAFNRCVWELHVWWSEYSSLYHGADVQEKLNLMNKVAPIFFKSDREAWLDRIFLGISRLMDNSQPGSRATLGIPFIIKKLDTETSSKIDPILKQITDLFSNVKVWRNKKISHNDLNFHLGITPLPNVQIHEIEKLILLMGDLANTISLNAYDESVSYIPDPILGGAEKLLSCLAEWQRGREITQVQ